MDYLKELSIQLRGKINTQNLYNWNFNATSFRKILVKDYKGYKLNINEFGSLYELSLKVESNFAFSINIPNKLFGLNKPTVVKNLSNNVYFSNKSLGPLGNLENKDFQNFWNSLSEIVSNLKLSENEGIFLYRNALEIAINSNRDLIPILDDAVDLITNHPAIFFKFSTERIFKKNIPESLHRLIPLLKKWSIPDDSEREQLMEETSEKQKQRLIKTVEPHLVTINNFLDSFKDESLSHEAMLLGNLAELISELKIDA